MLYVVMAHITSFDADASEPPRNATISESLWEWRMALPRGARLTANEVEGMMRYYAS